MFDFNLKNICRLCLTKLNQDGIQIFSLINLNLLENVSPLSFVDQKQKFSDFIMEFTSVKIEEQHNLITDQICKYCVFKITELYYYKLLIELNDSKIQELLKNSILNENKFIDSKEILFDNDEIKWDDSKIENSFSPDNSIENSDKTNFKLESNLIKEINESSENYDENSQYKCEVCKKSFRSLKIKLKHDKTKIHIEKEKRKRKKYKNEHFENNLNGINKKIETKFEKRKKYCRNDKISYNCDVCQKAFFSIESIKSHFEQHTILVKELNVFKINKSIFLDQSNTAICLICSRKYKSWNDLQAHINVHKPFDEIDCLGCKEKCLNLKEFYRHIGRKHKTRCFVCTKCVSSFQFSTDLKDHFHKEIKLEKYTCFLCNEKFSVHINLVEHLYVHSDLSHVCEPCNLTFETYKSLLYHKTQHKSIEPIPCCSICGKNDFNSKPQMARHVRQHKISSTPVQCKVCEKVLRSKDSWRIHMKIHLNKWLHVCNICGKKTRTACNMKTHHMISHSNERRYKCPFENCGKAFKTLQHCKRHERTHTGEKPFKCDICEKSFTEQGSLTEHLRLHTGEQPFACEVCGKKYSAARRKNAHMKKKHPERV